MELWFQERHSPDLGISIRTRRTLYRARSQYQEVAILETPAYGRVLLLDGIVQTTEQDEFVYHEMISHVPLCSHPCPRRVLVVGGGDGGTVREVLKHPSVQEVVLAEIDQAVINVSREYLPGISVSLSDPRCRIVIGDAIELAAAARSEYDVVIVDSTDPVGPATGLFTTDFYASVYRALRPDGIFTAQTESPFLQRDLIRDVTAAVGESFPIVRLCLAAIPTYPTGLWSFTIGSKEIDPTSPLPGGFLPEGLRYYSPEVHRAAFALPPFVSELTQPSRR